MSTHPITTIVTELRAGVGAAGEVAVWTMDAATTRESLAEVTRLAAQVAELELRLAAHAEAIAAHDGTGATSVADWWAHETRQTRPATRRKVRLAQGLGSREPTREALASGAALPDQASVILDAVDALPDDLDPATAALAEKHLVNEARHHDARALKILGRRVLEVLDPDAAEAHEAALLEAEERAALASARLTMNGDGHGRVHGRFTLPTLHGEMLRTMLTALASPRRHQHHKNYEADGGSAGARVPTTPERLGRAFCELLERYPAQRLPDTGGVSATVVVTMTLDTLLGGLAAASLPSGERLSAGQARRLACDAGLVPAVLGGDGAVLDLGRTARFHTRAQRLALALEQRGCMAIGCDKPPTLCHTHHTTPWSRGGATTVRDAVLLCPRHHTLIHREPEHVPLRT